MNALNKGLQRGAVDALAAVPAIPRDAAGPVFAEPWQAQVFAITLALHERGLFSWPEWATYLSAAIKQAQSDGDPDTGDSYYHHCLAALEVLLQDKGVAGGGQLSALKQAWAAAAESTPHGQPIEL